jgi:hypothetical protein
MPNPERRIYQSYSLAMDNSDRLRRLEALELRRRRADRMEVEEMLEEMERIQGEVEKV